MGPVTQGDLVKYRLDEMDEAIRALREEQSRGFDRLYDKLDARESKSDATALAVTKLEARLDSYKNSGKILLGVAVAVGTFLGWVLDIWDKTIKAFGKG